MEDLSVILSKIVATAKDAFWAQAYTAGKLYVVLSLSGESETSVAGLGKETLEKLQREFFALDEKTLLDIKKAVETVYFNLPEGIISSIILGTYVKNALYLVIAGAGVVFLKRGDTVSIIGNGIEKELSGFSGIVESEDLIVFTTGGFLQTVPQKTLTEALSAPTPSEAAETLAPLLHENALGTEAALIMKVLLPDSSATPEATEEIPEKVQTGDTAALPDTTPARKKFKLPDISPLLNMLPRKIPDFKKIGKKQILIAGVALLVIILLGSLLNEKLKRDSSKEDAIVTEILTPNKQKYEDAMGIMSLNKTLAVEELTDAKTDIEKGKEKLSPGGNGVKQLDAFLAQINAALEGKIPTNESQITILFDASKNSDIPTVSYVTAKGGQIAAVGSRKGGLLSSDGLVDSSFNGAANIRGITEDEKNIYVIAGSTVSQISKSDGSAKIIIEKQASPISIDTFGGNIYLLSSADKTVNKYRPSAYDKESYFVSDTTLTSPSSFTIDSSIYVLANGTIKKFTRGTEDSFSYKGLKLSNGSQIYTDVDYENLYVLDPTSKAATVVTKTGNVINTTSLKGMKEITSIAADEKAKKMYIVADNKIYQIGF